MNGLDAVGQRLNQRRTPTGGREGSNGLVSLFVGLREKLHGRIARSDVFADGDQELDIPVGLLLRYSEMVKLAQLFRRIALCVGPLCQTSSP